MNNASSVPFALLSELCYVGLVSCGGGEAGPGGADLFNTGQTESQIEDVCNVGCRRIMARISRGNSNVLVWETCIVSMLRTASGRNGWFSKHTMQPDLKKKPTRAFAFLEFSHPNRGCNKNNA